MNTKRTIPKLESGRDESKETQLPANFFVDKATL